MTRRLIPLLAALAALAVTLSAQGTLAPVVKHQFFDNNGLPAAGYKLCTYQAGTSVKQLTYADQTLLTANGDPIILDASGRPPSGAIFLGPASYKFILLTAGSDNTCDTGSTIWSQDNLAALAPFTVSSASATAVDLVETTPFVFGGTAMTPTTSTSFLSGATGDKLSLNTGIWNIDSTHLTGTYALEAMLATDVGSQTVSLELTNLTDGPDTPLVTITSQSTTGARVRSSVITFAAAGSAKDYGVKLKTTAGFGWAWSIRIVKTS